MSQNNTETACANVTQREKDVLTILWKAEKPLVASDIAKFGSGLSVNTVQSAIKSLLKKNLIEVADIVYSGTVFARNYRPKISQIDFLNEEMCCYFKEIEKYVSTVGIVSTLLEHKNEDYNVLDELEQMIKEKKRGLSTEGE